MRRKLLVQYLIQSQDSVNVLDSCSAVTIHFGGMEKGGSDGKEDGGLEVDRLDSRSQCYHL